MVTLGNSVKGSEVSTTLLLADVAEHIKSNREKVHCDYLRQEQDKKKRQAYKVKHLSFFISSGEWKTRDAKLPLSERWLEDSGGVILDYDEHRDKSLELKERVSKLPWVALAFISPSGGLKVVVQMEKVDTSTDTGHKRRWAYAVHILKELCGAIATEDKSGKDPTRVCFLSHDPEVYFNSEPEVLEVPEDWEPEKPPKKNLDLEMEIGDLESCWENMGDLEPDFSDIIREEEECWKELEKEDLLQRPYPSQSQVDNFLSTIPSIQGNGEGAIGMLKACRAVVSGFALNEKDQEEAIRRYAKTTTPPWPEHNTPDEEGWRKKLEEVRAKPYTAPEGTKPRPDGWLRTPRKEEQTQEHGPEVKAEPKKLSLQYFKDTQERTPEWLWKGHLLQGSTHVLGGRQGTSKGLFTVDITARLTNGLPMPDGTGGGDPKKVLIITREDDPQMALYPRLRVAGANMNNVAWTYGDFSDGAGIQTMREGAEAICQAVEEEGFSLVIIDPLGAWVESDMNNSQEVRAVIDPMNRMAMKTGCSVLFVAHLKKGRSDDLMDAFSGSAQVTASVRVALHIGPTGDGKGRLLQVAKTNFKRPDSPMVYELHDSTSMDPDDPPILAWREAKEDDIASAIERNKNQSPIIPCSEVAEFISAKHQKVGDLVPVIHKKLLIKPEFKKVSKEAVKTALLDLAQQGLAYLGETKQGGTTIGTSEPVEVIPQKDQAVELFMENPSLTVREVASQVGCSKSLAGDARKKAQRILKEEEKNQEGEPVHHPCPQAEGVDN